MKDPDKRHYHLYTYIHIYIIDKSARLLTAESMIAVVARCKTFGAGVSRGVRTASGWGGLSPEGAAPYSCTSSDVATAGVGDLRPNGEVLLLLLFIRWVHRNMRHCGPLHWVACPRPCPRSFRRTLGPSLWPPVVVGSVVSWFSFGPLCRSRVDALFHRRPLLLSGHPGGRGA